MDPNSWSWVEALVGRLGFPIVVALYVLMKLGPGLDKLRDEMKLLRIALSDRVIYIGPPAPKDETKIVPPGVLPSANGG